eukprot:3865870-Rhodomonas_salina.3
MVLLLLTFSIPTVVSQITRSYGNEYPGRDRATRVLIAGAGGCTFVQKALPGSKIGFDAAVSAQHSYPGSRTKSGGITPNPASISRTLQYSNTRVPWQYAGTVAVPTAPNGY